jgi:hypothetical protein
MKTQPGVSIDLCEPYNANRINAFDIGLPAIYRLTGYTTHLPFY